MSGSRRAWLQQSLGAAGLAALGLKPGSAQANTAGPGMRRGLNLTHWFEYERGQGVSRAEMQALAELGFDHVRLPVDPVVCGWKPVAGSQFAATAALSKALDDAIQAGLEVVLDLHLEPADKEAIERSAQGRSAVVALWAEWSREFAGLPHQRLAFELFNEPQFYGMTAANWAPFQSRMLDAVRARAPQHTVLLTGNQGGSFDGLQRLKPLQDAAAVYVFHYYAPYLFTHQGAHWMDTRYSTAGLHQGVRYPSSEQAGRAVSLSKPHPRAAKEMAEYLTQDWGAARIGSEIRQAADWGRRHGRRVVCNEFGVLRAAADAASRYRWIGDVRRALEAESLGWTLWDYTDIFGITVESAQPGKAGARQIDAQALVALGRAPKDSRVITRR